MFHHYTQALDLLPYTNRQHPFNAWTTTARGDIRTVGMAGATVGLADTFIASLDNPAGLAMTLYGGDTTFTSNTIYDGNTQNYDEAMYANDIGLAINLYPWGFSVGYVSPFQVGQPYGLASSPNDPTILTVKTRELYFSAARVFFNNRLALGGSLILGQSEHQMEFTNSPQLSASYHAYALGGNVGATFQFPNRFLLGLSYNLSMQYPANSLSEPTSGVTHFFQPINVPYRIGVGLGWIPNRFFRADISTFIIGTTDNAALLRDDSVIVGQYTTIQPKVGIAYQFLDFKNLQGTAFMGTYYEVTQVQDQPNRIHATGGFELKPWILTLGLGVDESQNYRNYLVSLGVDVFRVMEKLDIIPSLPRPSYVGAFPKTVSLSDEGLSQPLVKDWQATDKSVNPIQIGLDIPKRIKEKAKELGETMSNVFNSNSNSNSNPNKNSTKVAPTPIKKRKRRIKALHKH